MPPEYHAALDAGLEQLRITLTPSQRGQIDDHARLLLAWNAQLPLLAL